MAKKTSKKQAVVAPPSTLYRRIAFSFIAVALVVMGVVLYYSFAGATIVIRPKKEALTASLTVDVRANPEGSEVRGLVGTTVVDQSETVPVTGDGGTTTPAQATGTVTITNTTGRDQPLVKTTRLLTPDGILFRISETVLVPARGSVTVTAYADQPGTSGEIGPTRFTIPGLAVSLQDKIYAESTEPFCCGTKTVRVVTEDDIAIAEAALLEKIVAQATTDLAAALPGAPDLGGSLVLKEVIDKSVDAEPGTERTEFTIRLKVKVTTVFYDRAALLVFAEETLRSLAGEERELVELDPDRMTVTLERADSAAGTARLAVEATGLLVLRPDSALFDKDRLVGLDRAAVESYFRTFRSIESVRIEFRPPWLRTVPSLRDHIEIKIEE